MADIDLPLSEFWDSLEDKQRRSLLALRRVSGTVVLPFIHQYSDHHPSSSSPFFFLLTLSSILY